MNARFVTIKKCSELTGYSEMAIRSKISDGVWLERNVWVKAPDGRVLINMDGYEAWVQRGSSSSFGLIGMTGTPPPLTRVAPKNAARSSPSPLLPDVRPKPKRKKVATS